MTETRQRLRGDLLLLLAAVVWGGAFVAQRVAAGHVGVFLFNGMRFLLGALVLVPWAVPRGRPLRPTTGWAATAGTLLFAASALQQAGLRFTTAGSAGFLTGLYVVLVPLVLLIAWRRRVHWACWVAAVVAAAGVFLLSADAEFRLGFGDVLELAGALVWALHVIVVSLAVMRSDVVQFSVGQYIVAGLLNLALGMALDLTTLGGAADVWWTIAYTGVFSTAIGFTLQAVGQKKSPPSDAAIIMSSEAVFAALAGFIFLGECLALRQIAGCALILAAMIMAQVRKREGSTCPSTS